ncbi:MAG: MarR family transcriptional regulator [Eggerthellaceae bacterium]|jgi:DNA-binding MarR family transcriptional regulator|nr:MarR family transcriptional regulator [Eggerthellaceae bacterium]
MATNKQCDDIIEASVCFDGLARGLALIDRSTLSKTQILVMMAVNTMGPMSMTQTSERLAVSKEHVTRAVAPLVELGYVEKNRNAENYKVVDISLTDAGKERLAQQQTKTFEALSERLASLNAEETAELARLSHDSVKLIKKALDA